MNTAVPVAPYQVMPSLSAEEYAALRADIAERGVQVPVEYDEQSNVLDGHHRVQICRELGLSNWPRLVRYGLSDEEKRRHARRLNLDRRHLDQAQKRALIAAELREAPQASDRTIASGLGVDHKTVGSERDRLQSTGEIPQLGERTGRDRRVRKIVQFVPSTPEEEKGLSISARAIAARDRAHGAERRRRLATELSDASANLPVGRKFPIIYADPAWKRNAGIGDRAYENHFPTMTWDAICELPVAEMALPDAWLYLWIPRAHLLATTRMLHKLENGDTVSIPAPLAWRVGHAWGFPRYSTCFIWTKTDEEFPDDQGTGLIAYDQDELLLLFKRGQGMPKPDTDKKYGSNHRERARGHSRKPDFYRQMIRDMAGEGVPVLELFARADPDNPWPSDWHTWGNQAGQYKPADLAPHDEDTGELVGEGT